MTLKRRARNAGFSSRRADSDGRASVRRRRREEQTDFWARPQTALEESYGESARQAQRDFFAAVEEAEAGHESLDGLHPEETP